MGPVWRAGRGYIGHAQPHVMLGMHQRGLRRFPQWDARERSREPGRELTGGGGVVLGMSSQRKSAGASQRYLLAEPNWLECARNSVCPVGAAGPRGHMISNLVGTCLGICDLTRPLCGLLASSDGGRREHARL